MTGQTPATDVERTELDGRAAEQLGREIASGTFATIIAATRTRRRVSIADTAGAGFRLLRQSDGGWLRSTGPARRLASELVGVPGELEVVADVPPTFESMPYDASVPPLAPGELLALADVVRGGDQDRINAACEEIGLTGLPTWITQLAWGAEATLTLVLQVNDQLKFASLLQLLPSGWGILSNDENDDFTFHPMTTLEVQARLGGFAAALLESSDDDD